MKGFNWKNNINLNFLTYKNRRPIELYSYSGLTSITSLLNYLLPYLTLNPINGLYSENCDLFVRFSSKFFFKAIYYQDKEISIFTGIVLALSVILMISLDWLWSLFSPHHSTPRSGPGWPSPHRSSPHWSVPWIVH